MSAQMTVHNTAAPVATAAVSCAIGFNLHEFLGYAGQIVGLLSGVVSVSWVVYQMYQAYKRNKAAPK